MSELEKILDYEVNKSVYNRGAVENICRQILSDENCPTDTIRKIYRYIHIGAINSSWGRFPRQELLSQKNSPFKILEQHTEYKNITDILFISFRTSEMEIYFLIIEYLKSKNCQSEQDAREILDNLSRDETAIKSLSKKLNKYLPFYLRFRFIPFSTQIREELVLKNIRAMLRHLFVGYNLFSKIDELLIGLRPRLILDYSEDIYWRIVLDVKLSCQDCEEKIDILTRLYEGNIPAEISNTAFQWKAGFIARNFFPIFYRGLWRKRASEVCYDIAEHITKNN